jgi:hypothetical protein
MIPGNNQKVFVKDAAAVAGAAMAGNMVKLYMRKNLMATGGWYMFKDTH